MLHMDYDGIQAEAWKMFEKLKFISNKNYLLQPSSKPAAHLILFPYSWSKNLVKGTEEISYFSSQVSLLNRIPSHRQLYF